MNKEISKNRKTLYYFGNALSLIGFLLFMSVFFAMFFNNPIDMMGNPFTPMFPAFIGFPLIILGQFLAQIGLRGKAGSGLILDPRQAAEDLKPYSSQVGTMLNDALVEVDGFSKNKEIIKIRCRLCQSLNEEDAQYCKKCGTKL